jgi:Fibronectin type-III domain
MSAWRPRHIAYVREPDGVVVKVTPRIFRINPNASRGFSITFEARRQNASTFVQVVLRGDIKHVVRMPLVVSASASSTLVPKTKFEGFN